MKYLVSIFMILLMFILTSCKSDSSNPTSTGGLGGGTGPGGGGGSVTFAMSTKAGPSQGGTLFVITPSAAVVITSLTISLPAQNLSDPFTGDGTTVFPANQAQTLSQEYLGVATGQKWVFVFTGKLGSSTGTAFTVTSNFTIP